MAFDDGVLLDGSATAIAGINWPGGSGSFLCTGFASQTVTLQVLMPDATTWTAVGSDTTLTAGPGGNFQLPPCKLRASVTGGVITGLYGRALKHPA